MIHSFSCKNFYSFAGENTVDFLVNDKTPKSYGYYTTSSGTRLSKVETVIGPNASGKTNLLKVLPFFKWLIVNSFDIEPSAPIPVLPFLFPQLKNKPIETSVKFEMDGDIYTYSFILDSKKILKEDLKVKNKSKEKTTTKTLFLRQWEEESKKYRLMNNNFSLPKGFEKLLRTNASVIGIGMRLNHEKSEKIGLFWQKVKTNVIEAGWTGDSLSPKTNRVFSALNFFNKNKSHKSEAEKLLARFDLGFEAFDIRKEKKGDEFYIDAQVTHQFENQEYKLPFRYESSGTKQLVVLLETILQVLVDGGVAVIDEFDVNLHSDMVLALFELFLSPETNPKNAQILFSTHNHRILNELDKYQVVLVEKNKQGSSEVWRLDEMSGIRADDNYYTKYIAGAYGAIPKIN